MKFVKCPVCNHRFTENLVPPNRVYKSEELGILLVLDVESDLWYTTTLDGKPLELLSHEDGASLWDEVTFEAVN